MLTIRLLRKGKKRQPVFKIVVTDKNNPPKAGRFVDDLGFYNPLTKEISIDGDRTKDWIKKGAKVSDTVFNILVGKGVLEGKKIPKHKIAKKGESEEKSQAKESSDKEEIAKETKKLAKEETNRGEESSDEKKAEESAEEGSESGR